MKSLAQVIADHRIVGSCGGILAECACGDAIDDHAAHVAAAYRAERTITTEAGLDALPWHTLIVHNGSPLRKQSKSWYAPASGLRCPEPPLPAFILWMPGDEA